MSTTSRTNREDQIRRDIARLSDELARLRALPDGASMPNGTVLAVALAYRSSGRGYQYVALKVADRWYFTGKGPHRATWDQVAEWLSRPQVRIIAAEPIAELLTLEQPPGAVELGDMIQSLAGKVADQRRRGISFDDLYGVG